MGKLKNLLIDCTKQCHVCGSPMPPEYVVCFVCLSDQQRHQIRKLEAELAAAEERLKLSPRLNIQALEEDLLEKFNITGGRFPLIEEIINREKLTDFIQWTKKYIITDPQEEK